VVVVVEEGIVAVPAGARIGICGGKLNCFVDGIYIRYCNKMAILDMTGLVDCASVQPKLNE
jgi:hypothetical protein